jgi:hypothetical protein
MNNGEIVDVLINHVEDAGGVLFIQSGTIDERPQSQQVGNLFIDITTRIIYRFDGQTWESILSSSGLIEPSVSQKITELSKSVETIKPEDSSPIVRSKNPF